MITGIDHVVLLAADLEPAMRAFERAGFGALRGGTHPDWGTENALVPLADGFYLELLARRDPSLAARHRLWLRPDGGPRRPGEYGGFALASDDLRADVRAAAARGLEFAAPVPGGRRRPDGTTVRWMLSTANRPDLPFLIEDLTPRSVRVPAPAGPLNTRARLADVTVAVENAAEAFATYAALLGRPATSVGNEERAIDTGRGRIVLTELERVPGAASEPGLLAVRLAVTGGPSRDLVGVTGGARLHLIADG
jgi:catechol 2,3-dioxygenase-like lactoylglutathione lyase family enzyme